MATMNQLSSILTSFDESYTNLTNVKTSQTEVSNAINDAVEQYITCVECNADYEDTFEKSFPYVYINKKKENADE